MLQNGNDNLILPGELNADAVVPQCLDNQFVSNRVCTYMVTNRVDYNNKKVFQMRKEDSQAEFIRSLIYSSQVIINRYFFRNSQFLYYNYLPQELRNQNAFVDLILNSRIVPYLMKEESLTENLDLNIREEGDRALYELLNKTGGNIKCLRFARKNPDGDDKNNQKRVDKLYSKFGAYFSSLKSIIEHESLFNNMLSELNSSMIGFWSYDSVVELNAEERKAIKEHLDSLATFSFNNPAIVRNEVYKKFFVEHSDDPKILESNVVNGVFKDFKEERYLFLLKKLVDLRYNSNLSDMLKRYTFTPIDMPSRIALQDSDDDDSENEVNDIKKLIEQSVDHFRDITLPFMAQNQKGMYLPLFTELSVADVVEIQAFDEWHEFIDAQKYILNNPLKILDKFNDYNYKLIQLQKQISKWYLDTKKPTKKTTSEKGLWPYVTILIQAGSLLVPLGILSTLNINDILKKILTSAFSSATGYVLKIMVNMIDLDTRQINKELSYNIEVIKDNSYITKGDLEEIVKKAYKLGGDYVKQTGKVPEQSK